MEKFIHDRDGRALVLVKSTSGQHVYFYFNFNKVRVAYANCLVEGDTLVLLDLCVENNLQMQQPNFWKRRLGQPTIEVNFREQGIGSELLNIVIEYGKDKGFKYITGTLGTVGLDPNLDLKKWYNKRGFTVDETTIFMDLAKAQMTAA